MSIPFGKYQLQCKLADGGMAEVFLARQTGVEGFEKLVVCKRIRPELSQDAGFVQMFLNEARVAARLNHPNIVQIFELGRVDATYFITMEFIHGEDLRTLTREAQQHGEPPQLGLSCRILADMLAGLHYAHTRPSADGKPLGLVHRDVSPQNVLVTYEGGVKLVDFGIAKVNQRGMSENTRAGLFKGKFAYMSPEQSRGQPLDARSDIFAAGVLLWELITWTRLFKRANDMATLVAVAEDEIPRPRSFDGKIPPELERIVMRALDRDVTKRYQTAQEMRADLEALIRAQSWEADALALAAYMNRLFARKLASQARDVAASGRGSLEDFLLALEDDQPISWIGPAPEPPQKGDTLDSLNGLVLGGDGEEQALDELPASATAISSMPQFAEGESGEQPESTLTAESTPHKIEHVPLGSSQDDMGFLKTAARAGMLNTAALEILPLPEAKTEIGVVHSGSGASGPPSASIVLHKIQVSEPDDPTRGAELPALATAIHLAPQPEAGDLPSLSTAITGSRKLPLPGSEEPITDQVAMNRAVPMQAVSLSTNDAPTGSHAAFPEGHIPTQVGAQSQAARARQRRVLLFGGATLATIVVGVVLLLLLLPRGGKPIETPGVSGAFIDVQLDSPAEILLDGQKVADGASHLPVKIGAEHVVVVRRAGHDKTIHVPAMHDGETFPLKLH